MSAYENLANAIILQAVKDYRATLKYLKRHPRTKELEEAVAFRKERRKKREAKRKEKGLPKVKEKRSREELLLDKINDHERERDSIQRFFRSDWYKCLTDVDGEMLLRKLNEEV